jgi:hypothetical protein
VHSRSRVSSVRYFNFGDMRAQFNREQETIFEEATMFVRFLLQLITGDKGLGVDPNG